tara:strand:+ start:278 stop:493 length:216 start_codon:yes stop_codon:yes gene_type:complete
VIADLDADPATAFLIIKVTHNDDHSGQKANHHIKIIAIHIARPFMRFDYGGFNFYNSRPFLSRPDGADFKF